MTKGSESSTCCPANPVMSASPPATIVDSSKQCSTATAPEFLGATCRKRFGNWKNTHKRLSRWAKKGAWQRQAGHQVNRKRVQRLMRLMGLEALGPKPKTSRPSAQHRIYPLSAARAD